MTEVEPEFDANERDSWDALREYREAVCPHCGNLRAVCSDPNVDVWPQRNVCYVTAAHEVTLRKWHKVTEDAKPDAEGFMVARVSKTREVMVDGTTVWMATEDLTPDDDFL